MRASDVCSSGPSRACVSHFTRLGQTRAALQRPHRTVRSATANSKTFGSFKFLNIPKLKRSKLEALKTPSLKPRRSCGCKVFGSDALQPCRQHCSLNSLDAQESHSKPKCFSRVWRAEYTIPRPSIYPLLDPKCPLFGAIHPYLRLQGGSW